MMFFCWLHWLLRLLGILDLTPPWWYFHQKLPLSGKLVAKSLSWSSGTLSQIIILEKNDKRYPTIDPSEEGKNIGKLIIIRPIKRELWFWPNHNLALLEDFKIPTPYHCTCIKPLVCWQDDSVHGPALVGKCIRPWKVPTSPVPPVQSTVQGNLLAEMDFIQLPPLTHNYVLTTVCIFSHGTKTFSCRPSNAASVRREDPYLENTSQTRFDNSLLFAQFFRTFYHAHHS